MTNKSARDVFEVCLTLEPGFTQAHVEDLLGLRQGVLQRYFTKTGAFRKLPVGYTLATRIFEDWCVLAGIEFAPVAKALLASQTSKVDPTGIPVWLSEKVLGWDTMDMTKLVSMIKTYNWDRLVTKLLDGSSSLEQLADIRVGMLYLALMADYAMNDPRYKVAPQTIWESRPL